MRTSRDRRGLETVAVPGKPSIFSDFASFLLSGYQFRKIRRCRGPRRPPRLFQRWRFALQLVQKKSQNKMCSFQHRSRSQQFPHPHKTSWSFLHFDCSPGASNLDRGAQLCSCSKFKPTVAEGRSCDFSKQLTRWCKEGGLKNCSSSPYSSLCWSSKRCVTNFVFCYALVRVRRSLSLSSEGIQRWYALNTKRDTARLKVVDLRQKTPKWPDRENQPQIVTKKVA